MVLKMNSLPLPIHILSLSTYIYDDRHGSIVHWLGAVGPEVRALGEVNVTGTQAAKRGGETKYPTY